MNCFPKINRKKLTVWCEDCDLVFEDPNLANKIAEFIKRMKTSDANSNQILPLLDKIEERQYQNVADISLSAKLVQ
jgi:hypothetical protein